MSTMRSLLRIVGILITAVELCVQSVTLLKDHLQTQIRSIPEQNCEVVHRYLAEMADLLECLRVLQQEWLQYQEVRETAPVSMAYHVSIEHGSLERGRPHFEISRCWRPAPTLGL